MDLDTAEIARVILLILMINAFKIVQTTTTNLRLLRIILFVNHAIVTAKFVLA